MLLVHQNLVTKMVKVHSLSDYVLQIYFMFRKLQVKMGLVKHLDVRKEGRILSVIPCRLSLPHLL